MEWAFVLDEEDPYTPAALHAYANACQDEYPLIARDLYAKATELRAKHSKE